MAKVIASTKDMGRADWLQIRSKYIGGSDASIVLGLNKWKTPFELYLEKTDQVELEEIDNEAIYFGNALEDFVAKEFERRTGKKVRRKNQMLQHDEHEFMMANLDRVIVGENAFLEVKTTSAYNAKEWEGDEIPVSYLVQVNHYLAVTGADYCYICVLIGGQKFIWKKIDRDEDLINMIIQAEKHFWENHILANIPPALDGSSAAEKFIKARFEKAEKGKIVDLKHEHNYNIQKIFEYKKLRDDFDKEIKALENALKMDIGEAEAGHIDGFVVNWKNVVSNRVDSKLLKSQFPEIAEQVTKASNSRRFEIKEVK